MPRSIALILIAIGLAFAGLFLVNLELALNAGLRSHGWASFAVGVMLSLAALAMLFLVAGVGGLREASRRASATHAMSVVGNISDEHRARQNRARTLLGWPTLVAIVIALGIGGGCSKPRVEAVTHVVIECLEENQDSILSALLELGSLLTNRDRLLERATELGVPIGGCALAKLIQAELTPRRGTAALDLATARELRETWDIYRREVAGERTVFRLETGDL